MNVLEKILEEVDKKADYYECEEQGREHIRMVDMVEVEEIIHSHMDDAENDGWIPVDERLPEDGETVLCTDGEDIFLVEYEASLDVGFGDMDWITAWQPLPEAYRPEEELN